MSAARKPAPKAPAPPAKPKHAGGRPRVHDRAAVMAAVCERIATGELVQDVARDLGVTPWQVSEWATDPQFSQVYARARSDQAHAVAALAYREAMNADREDAQAARLRFDAGRWLASKLAPREYGEKQTVEHDGAVKLTLSRAAE